MELGNILFGNSRGEVPIERDWHEEVACAAMYSCGFDTYGIIQDERLRRFVDSSHLSDDVNCVRIGNYEIMPYYWGDADAHPDVAEYPNFIDHERNVSIQWYKYAMRDAYANREIDDEEWSQMWREFADYVNARLNEVPAID